MSGPVLVTGGAGFIGANLADRLASEGHDVLVYDNLARPGVDANVAWLLERWGTRVTFIRADVREVDTLVRAVREAAVVFHYAAQVAVTTSMERPLEDFATNVEGTLCVLEAIRLRREPIPLLYSSTNKVYGDLHDVELERTEEGCLPRDGTRRRAGVSETRPLDFHTPYGCSKGAADQYVLDYCRSFGVPTCVLRMSCIYGRRQMGTEDQGWVAHFALRALERQPVTIYGDGHQVRDILWVDDAVTAYVEAWRHIHRTAGRAFNLGGGSENAVSLRRLVAHLEMLVGHAVRLEMAPWRPGDQRWYVSDPRRARSELGLAPFRPWRDGVAELVHWLAADRGLEAAAPERLAV